MAKIVDIVKKSICPIIESLGYSVVEVEYGKKIDGLNLTFYIDSPNGITLDDCEKVHKAIDGPLDELNPTSDVKYILNVSSCGLDRPLKTDFDLRRNVGKSIEVKLYKAIEKQKLFIGKLTSFDNNTITLDDSIQINRKDIANIVLYLDF